MGLVNNGFTRFIAGLLVKLENISEDKSGNGCEDHNNQSIKETRLQKMLETGITMGFVINENNVLPYMRIKHGVDSVPGDGNGIIIDDEISDSLFRLLGDLIETETGALMLNYLAAHCKNFPEDQEIILSAIDKLNNYMDEVDTSPVISPTEVFRRA